MKQKMKIFMMLLSLLIVLAGYAEMDTSPIRVNQVGYFPEGNKVATIVDTRTTGLGWQLRSASGQIAATGTTRVYGNDTASGDFVHKADFSSYTQAGADYRLWVAGIGESVPFTIASNIYSGLEKDAMAYFYFHRMGEAVQSQYLEYSQHAQPPSTAATYAVARIPAQLARVYRNYDPAYASLMWDRAELARIAWYLNDRSRNLGTGTVATPTPLPPTSTPTPAPSTVTPPPHLIDLSGGMWRTFIDPYGSTVYPAPNTNALAAGVASASFTMMPEPTANGDYPYGGLLFAFDNNNYGRYISLPILFTYMSTGSIRFSIAQPNLAENGEAWGYNLPPAAGWTTIGITKEMLSQPAWVTVATPLDLSGVVQFKWEPKLGAPGGNASVNVANFMVGAGDSTPGPTATPNIPTNPPTSMIDVSQGVWGTYADTYGSTVSPAEGSNALVGGVAAASFNIMPEPTASGQYPFAGLYFNFDVAGSARHIGLPITFTYTSTGNIRFNIGQPVLKDNGEAWGYYLPATSTQRTITITEAMLSQPSWVSSATPLDLTGVLQLKWEPKMGSAGGAASITVRDLAIPEGSGGSAIAYGDVNNDGFVNIIDALMVAQYYVGFYVPGFVTANADVNRDKQINIIDALIIAQYYVGLIPSLPI